MQRILLLVLIMVSVGTISMSFRSSGSVSEAVAAPLTPPLTAPVFTDEVCGTKVDDLTRAELAKTEAARKWFALTKQPTPNAVVNVHFHVIQNAEAGAVDDATIATQINVLNDSFNLR